MSEEGRSSEDENCRAIRFTPWKKIWAAICWNLVNCLLREAPSFVGVVIKDRVTAEKKDHVTRLPVTCLLPARRHIAFSARTQPRLVWAHERSRIGTDSPNANFLLFINRILFILHINYDHGKLASVRSSCIRMSRL